MAILDTPINTEEASKDYRPASEIIPPGNYNVVIIESTVQTTHQGGKMLVLKLELQDGTKRTVIDRLNMVNASEVAQKIGRAALGKIALVIGHKGVLSNTDVLHGRHFGVKVGIEDFESKTEKGKMLKGNKVTDYFEKISSHPSSASTQPAEPGAKPKAAW